MTGPVLSGPSPPAVPTGWWRPGRCRTDRLTVLMYHKVDPAGGDPWTVTPAELDEQWTWLGAAGYRAISCRDLIGHLNQRRPLPSKPLLITFDDGYRNNLVHAFPLLAKHNLRATLFVPVKFIGGRNEWDGGGEQLLDYDELRAVAGGRVEIGLHSYTHDNFRALSLPQIEADLRRAVDELARHHVPFLPALAYPYGALARGWCSRRALKKRLPQIGIECAFRIGNRLNRLPLAGRYAIQRIDVRANESLSTFRAKLAKRLNPLRG